MFGSEPGSVQSLFLYEKWDDLLSVLSISISNNKFWSKYWSQLNTEVTDLTMSLSVTMH